MPARPSNVPATAAAAAAQAAFHAGVVQRVADAVATHDVVVVGMSVNPHVGRARAALTEAGIAYDYIELGGYHNQWKPRLAIKMWSGWPTFPQVFVKGRLVGGNSDLRAALADGTVKALLDGERA
jgi:glutaredoxin-related protein